MKSSFLLASILASAVNLSAQQPDFLKEQWSDKPAIHQLDQRYDKESAVILLDKRRVEYIDDKAGELNVYRTLHRIVRVNDDTGIESFNKVYLSVTDKSEIADIRARTILPNGKVIEIDKNNIRDQKDEDGTNYKIFALEGLEKGCEIEFYYTYKRNPTYFGRELIQGPFPVVDAVVEIVSPERLTFETKNYNGSPVKKDTVLNGKKMILVTQQSLAGIEQEKYSYQTANLQRVEYKLSYNSARTQNDRLFTWNELATRLYQNYTTVTDKEAKRAAELASKNKWDKLATDKEKILAVEHYLKKNIAARKDIGTEDASNLEKIIRNKLASHFGIIRLYAALYKSLNVPFQFVLTGDRTEFEVDKSFENWDNTENPILYFPGEKAYLAPTLIEMRYPWIYPTWGGTDGLFCKTTTIGNFTTAVAEIRPIALHHYSQSASNIDAIVKLNKQHDSAEIDVKQSFNGYSASVYRASYNFSSADQQREIVKSLIKFATNTEHILSSKIENQDFESYPDNKPFVLQANVRASELIEKAGNKLLLKIGLLIGAQAEMYQEKERKLPMQLEYPHVLERTIRFEIPDGYTVVNAADLNLNQVINENGEPTMGFVSKYTIDKNILSIHIMEEYRKTFYPKDQYEAFKKVINTAADFNKIALVLEKKS
ncbi:MAG: DUF3857 domain-containing protein [Chitinophagaceae bacterium]|nr:MAG: DUF3857 domain-containing protein [Chitinophagaceae bacterium]